MVKIDLMSPNEKENLRRALILDKRKQRLLETRIQAKNQAATVRAKVKLEYSRQIQRLALKLYGEWQARRTKKLQELESIFNECISDIGRAHTAAVSYDYSWLLEKYKSAVDNCKEADVRFQEALKRLRAEQREAKVHKTRIAAARANALCVERERAYAIAHKPPTAAPKQLDQIEQELMRLVNSEQRQLRRDELAVRHRQRRQNYLTDKSQRILIIDHHRDGASFTSSHYSVYSAPNFQVVKSQEASSLSTDGKSAAIVAAEVEQSKSETLRAEAETKKASNARQAMLRHRHALERERLQRDYASIMKELGELVMDDARRRAVKVDKIPLSVYASGELNEAAMSDHQRHLETAIERAWRVEFAGDDQPLALDAASFRMDTTSSSQQTDSCSTSAAEPTPTSEQTDSSLTSVSSSNAGSSGPSDNGPEQQSSWLDQRQPSVDRFPRQPPSTIAEEDDEDDTDGSAELSHSETTADSSSLWHLQSRPSSSGVHHDIMADRDYSWNSSRSPLDWSSFASALSSTTSSTEQSSSDSQLYGGIASDVPLTKAGVASAASWLSRSESISARRFAGEQTCLARTATTSTDSAPAAYECSSGTSGAQRVAEAASSLASLEAELEPRAPRRFEASSWLGNWRSSASYKADLWDTSSDEEAAAGAASEWRRGDDAATSGLSPADTSLLRSLSQHELTSSSAAAALSSDSASSAAAPQRASAVSAHRLFSFSSSAHQSSASSSSYS